MRKFKNLKYFEPREDGDYEVVVSPETVIANSKKMALKYKYVVLSDEEAYNDFIPVFWASPTEDAVGEKKLPKEYWRKLLNTNNHKTQHPFS